MTVRDLPTVVVSSVIRSSHQGESHGGVYLVDLAAGRSTQVLDWDDAAISFEGRGGDRGLRGIAFHSDRIYLAASDEVFVFDRDFGRLGSIRNRYLRHCHEIAIDGDLLHLTSTGYDSLLTYDLRAERFVTGRHLSWGRLGRWRRRRLADHGDRPVPRLERFSPEEDGGPEPGDTCHINNVHAVDGRVFVSGTSMGHLLEVTGQRAVSHARIPYGTHNARPFRGGALLNSTAEDAVVWQTRRGRPLRRFAVPHYELVALTHTDVPGDHARQAFGRGLAVHGEVLVAGSSPATVTAYDLGTGDELARVNLSRDVRNATHGLEVWPFG